MSTERDVTPLARPDKGGSRYASRMRRLKIALPLLAAGTLALIFLGSRDNVGERLGLSPEDRAALGEGLRLFSPTFTGATERGEPYALTADWALPDGPNPEKIDLSGLEGRINMADGREVIASAPEGQFRPKARGLTLSGGVEIDSSDGYSVRAESAELDGVARILTSDSPIEAWGPSGRIKAGSMRATRDELGNDVVRFDGGVRLVFRPDGARDAAPGGESDAGRSGEGKRQP